jgi:Tol biopolymer transport system component
MPNSWSSDGKFLAFNHINILLTGTWDIGILPLEGDGEPEYLLASDANECCPKFSPDGRWLAYVSDETGKLQVYVRPFPGPDVQWLISDEEEGGDEPVWSPDGRELFYRSRDRTMAVPIQTQGQTLTAGTPKVLFEGQYVDHSDPSGFQYYDISPDGERFLMLKEVTPEATQINVVLNWFEELKRLVPTN